MVAMLSLPQCVNPLIINWSSELNKYNYEFTFVSFLQSKMTKVAAFLSWGNLYLYIIATDDLITQGARNNIDLGFVKRFGPQQYSLLCGLVTSFNIKDLLQKWFK